MKLIVRNSGKDNKRLYIQKSIRKNGKCSSVIVESLGSLSQLAKDMEMTEKEVIAWGEKRAEQLTEKERSENQDVVLKLSQSKTIKNGKRSFMTGQLFLQEIYSQLRFDNVFRNIKARNNYEYDAESIFSDLIFSRILEPGSKRSSYETAKSFLEPPKYDSHQVYRALSLFHKEMDYILSETYKNSNFLVNRNNHILYYDCTNYYFEIEEEDDFRKYGKSKENRPNPIVQMGLFMDGNGLPLSFSVFEGNTNEQLSLKPLEQKIINDFDLDNLVICTDAGLASKTNKLFNNTSNRKYIITQSIKKLNKDDKQWALDKEEYFYEMESGMKVKIEDMVNDKLYYREETMGDKNIPDQRLIVTYSPLYASYQKNIRDKQVIRADKMIKSGKTKKTHSNPNDPARFISKTATTKDGELAEIETCSLNEEKINDEANYDGFYGIVTNLDDDVKDIVRVNEKRWEIEESFRIMKTDFEARPVYLQRSERIEAHFLICFMALLIYRIIEKKLDNKYTTTQIIKTLREYKHLKIEGCGYLPEFERNEITDDLQRIFNLNLDKEIITQSTMRSIINKTKKFKQKK